MFSQANHGQTPISTKLAHAAKLLREGKTVQALEIYHQCVEGKNLQDQNTTHQEKILNSEALLHYLECMQTCAIVPYDEFIITVMNAFRYVKNNGNHLQQAHINNIIYDIKREESKKKYDAQYVNYFALQNAQIFLKHDDEISAFLRIDTTSESSDRESSAQSISDHSKTSSSRQSSPLFHLLSPISLPRKLSIAEENDSEADDNDPIVAFCSSAPIVIEKHYGDRKPVIYSPISPEQLPALLRPEEKAPLRVFNPVTLSNSDVVHTRLFVEDFDDAFLAGSIKGQLEVMRDFSQYLHEQWVSNAQSAMENGDHKKLLIFAQALYDKSFGKYLPKNSKDLLKNRMMDLSRAIVNENIQNKSKMIENLHSLTDALNKLLDSYIKPLFIEEEKNDTKQSNKRKSTQPSTTQHAGLFVQKKKEKTSGDNICDAMLRGDLDALSELIGYDDTCATRFIPGDSGDTYLMFAVQCRSNVQAMVALLFPATLLNAKAFRQIFQPSNYNDNHKCIVTLAVENNNMDHLLQGITFAALQHGKNPEVFTKIVNDCLAKLSNTIRLT